jgi:hypothetical protein
MLEGYSLLLALQKTTASSVAECPIKGHTVKKRLSIFPSPGGMSLTKFSLAGNN